MICRPTLSTTASLLWPAERADEALRALARGSGIAYPSGGLGPLPADTDPESLEHWLADASLILGGTGASHDLAHEHAVEGLQNAAPALVAVPPLDRKSDNPPSFLVVVRSGRGCITALDINLRPVEVAPLDLLTLLAEACHQSPRDDSADLLMSALQGVTRVTPRTRVLMDACRLRYRSLCQAWPLTARSRTFGDEFAREGGVRRIAFMVVAHGAYVALTIVTWRAVGASLVGSGSGASHSWLWAALWLAASLSRSASARWARAAGIDLGVALRRRIIAGALRTRAHALRAQGTGRLLGRVLEAESIESHGIGSVLLGATAAVELVAAGLLLASDRRAAALVPLLLLVVAGFALVARRHVRRVRRATQLRREMTCDLVDRMTGHRTVALTTTPDRSPDAFDARYSRLSTLVDGDSVAFVTWLPRTWLVLGVLALVGIFGTQARHTPAFVVALGAVLFGWMALRRLGSAITPLADALAARSQLSPLLAAARFRDLSPATPAPSLAMVRGARNDRPLLVARRLRFRHRGRNRATVDGCDLEVWRGDRLLLQGPSGSGKSTVAALLAGLRTPSAGTLMLAGYDRHCLGRARWRRAVAMAPQFHENRIFTHTLLFNLLMGRRWPPRTEDLQEAQDLCLELGLGPLLRRMPSGLQQVVGETGWQLSHGERARLFLARTLLQPAELHVLDETFAALDPEVVAELMPVVLRRAPTLIVIAHP